MMYRAGTTRTGAIVPLTAICLIALIGMVALCIDLSILALGKTQCQNVADMSAMAAARSLDGSVSTNNNINAAFANGKTTAAAGKVLGQDVLASQADIKIGVLYYDAAGSPPGFVAYNLITEDAAGPPPSGNNWGMAESRITTNVNFSFAKVFGITSMPVEAVAQAIHRPRDVGIIMDYSGSMSFDSYLARPKTSSTNNPPYASLNNDPRIPRFGHYDETTPSSSNSTDPPYNQAGLLNSDLPGSLSGAYVRTDSQEIFALGNQTHTTAAGNPIIEDYYTDTGSGSMVRAFTGGAARTPVSNYDSHGFPNAIPNWTGSLGDRPLRVNTNPDNIKWPTGSSWSYTPGTEYLKNAWQYSRPMLDSNNPSATVVMPPTLRQDEFENLSTSANTMYSTSAAGFTYGPGYWGKTFFIWPPLPDSTSNPTVGASTTATNTTIRDWRQRFFWAVNTNGSTKKRLDDNNILYLSSGQPRNPNSTYTDSDGQGWRWQPNYEAILEWIRNTGPNPFPDNVRSGRILYYDAIPTTVANYGSDMNQRFWKEYIDWVTGYNGFDTSGSTQYLLSGYGRDFLWSDASNPGDINTKPDEWIEIGRLNSSYSSGTSSGTSLRVRTATYSNLSRNMLNWVPPNGTQIRFGSANSSYTYTISSVTTNVSQWTIRLNERLSSSISSGNTIWAKATPAYMDYRDNPYRPKHRFWFGPLTFGDFIWNDYDNSWHAWRSGTCHEAPMWVLKTGIQSALEDIEKNHPNDWVTLINFSVPKSSSGDSDNSHRFNRPRGPLGKNYAYMKNSLWYPPAVIQADGSLISRSAAGGEIRPYTSSWGVDQRYREAPFAAGGTCPMWGFTLAYNQFSSNPSLLNYDSGEPLGTAGGRGRLGARKLLVFETDGVPNHTATAGFTNNGAGQSYYRCRQPNEHPSVSSLGNMNTTVIRETYRLVRSVCDNASGNTSGNVTAYLNASSTETISRASGVPGYSTSNRPVLVHSLAFGGLFESTSSLRPDCLAFLQTVQTFGNTQTNASTPLSPNKVITGTSDERIEKIKNAFTVIMQDGVQISLYK